MDPQEAAGRLAWDYRLPVLTNLFLWYDLVKVFLIVYVIVLVLMTAIFAMAGDLGSVGAVIKIFAVVCAGLAASSVPIAAVWYANRAHVRFELSRKGVLYRTLEPKDRALNRALFILGVLAGKPSVAGTGLLAASRETEFTPWKDVTRVREHPSLGAISLVGGWRVVQRLHCEREDFARIAAFVRAHVPECATGPLDSDDAVS